jgi:hypothetical protein
VLKTSVKIVKVSGPDVLMNQGDQLVYQYNSRHTRGNTEWNIGTKPDGVNFTYSNDGKNNKLIISATKELFTPTSIAISATNNGEVAKSVTKIGMPTSIDVVKTSGSDSLINVGDHATYKYNVIHPYGITKWNVPELPTGVSANISKDTLTISAVDNIYISDTLNVNASTGNEDFTSNTEAVSINLATAVVINKISGPAVLANQGDQIVYRRTVIHPGAGDTV